MASARPRPVPEDDETYLILPTEALLKRPPRETLYHLTRRDWERLLRYVERARKQGTLFFSWGSSLATFAFSTALTIITLWAQPNTDGSLLAVAWLFFVGFSVSAVYFLTSEKNRRDNVAQAENDLGGEMAQIEALWKSPDPDRPDELK
jgi:hypothetical protein